HHSLFELALETSKKVISTPADPQSEINLGALVATIVTFTDEVDELLKLIRLLTGKPFYCETRYWSEYFYCFLTALAGLMNMKILPDGRRHYQLHYAMHLFETSSLNCVDRMPNIGNNGFGSSSRSTQTRNEHQLTHEQRQIVDYDLKR